MFSRNTYLFPPSLHPRTTTTTPFVDLNGVEFLLHHHPELFSGGHYFAPNNPPTIETSLNQHGGETSAMAANTSQRKQTPKKDRHSKIYTSQGPRDRRVRLSIGIARKFFDLQEMLGFDKPSKTLDWLLTKSKAAIKELVMQTKEKTKSSTSCRSSPSHECEMLSSSAGNGINSFNGADESERKFGKDNPQQTVLNLAKESRAKARARARERTKEKMSIKQIHGGGNININNGSNFNNTFIPIDQCMRNNQVDGCQLSGAGCSSSNNVSSCHQLSNEDLIQESIAIKRRPKNNNNSPSFFGFNQQNVIVSRELMSSNYGVQSANSSSQNNWDNICAILDQHKFINSNSNI